MELVKGSNGIGTPQSTGASKNIISIPNAGTLELYLKEISKEL